MTLTQSEYGDVTEDRYYSYTIEVQKGNQIKKVLYKSSPWSSPKPKPFEELEVFLLKLIETKFKKDYPQKK
jgi:hypothetical protein